MPEITTPSSVAVGGADSHAAPRGYRTAREVQARAAVGGGTDTPENNAALTRLRKSLEGNGPLRQDVPRGYYLNISV